MRVPSSSPALLVLGTLLLGCAGSKEATAPPAASFILSPASPQAGQAVTFTDTSTQAPTRWTWSFGDGGSSTLQNPTHTFTAAGTYTVALQAGNAGGSATASRTVTVAAPAVFTLTSTVGAEGGQLPVDFTLDGSGASPDLAWAHAPAGTTEFALIMSTLPGDGTTNYNWVLARIPAAATGLARNASGTGTPCMTSHSVLGYAPPQSPGPGAKVYTITLHALSGSPALGSDPSLVTGAVLAQAIAPLTLGTASLNLSYARTGPAAGFTAATDGLGATFTSASGLSASGWAWTFGDGATSAERNPAHTYAAAGTYTVGLTVSNAFGSNTVTRSVTVGGSAAAPQAAFTWLSAAGAGATLRSGHAIAFTDASTGSPASWTWDFGDGATSTERNPVHIFDVPAVDAPDATKSFTVTLRAGNASGTGESTRTLVVHQPEFNLYQGISDEAQAKTISFSGFAMVTGEIHAQTFFPPGKVADYTGFQYLRDNDPSGMGHNTSFVTRAACNVIKILTPEQLAQLATLARNQVAAFQQYGYRRHTLMQAFRMLMDGNLPAGTTGLDLDAVKAFSADLYRIDGQISHDRALLYAAIIQGMSADQLAYLDAMKGRGWAGWPDVTMDDVRSRLSGLDPGTNVLVMTYAGDILSWYNGSVDADVYFCPERHGTYYGGFYMKDAPAIGHEGYAISTTLTATAGSVLLGLDGSNRSAVGQAPYYITQAQADLMASLATAQKAGLSSGDASIVGLRTRISTLLRSLLLPGADAAAVRTQVLDLSAAYGALDGANNHNYATVFAAVRKSLSASQRTALGALRTSILTGTYTDGTPFDFTNCTSFYLYSDVVTAAQISAYVDAAATTPLFK